MAIEAYHFGRIRIDGQRYTADVIVRPGVVRADWRRREGHRLDPDDLADILADPPEVLVIGTGCFGRMAVPDETLKALEARGIRPLAMRTGQAVSAFNRLAREQARVAAALHLTC
jgi:hypothetical protein